MKIWGQIFRVVLQGNLKVEIIKGGLVWENFGQIWEHSRAEFKGHKEVIFQHGRFNCKNLKHEIT